MSAAGEKILGSIREARAILRGESAGELVVHVPPQFDVRALRRKLGMSQSRFAKSFGFGLAAAVCLTATFWPIRIAVRRLEALER